MKTNPIDRFEKIYCINLDKRKDRWKKCIEEFKKIDILDRVERFSAIEHKIGECGCRLSHTEVIKKCKEEGYKNVLIFEDDVEFLHIDAFYKILNNSFKQMKKSGVKYDMFYLGGKIKGTTNTRIQKNLVKLDNVKTTHAYAVTEKLYDSIIDSMAGVDIEDPQNWDLSNKNRYNVDYWYTQKIHPKYKVYGVYPMLAKQAAGYSNLLERDSVNIFSTWNYKYGKLKMDYKDDKAIEINKMKRFDIINDLLDNIDMDDKKTGI